MPTPLRTAPIVQKSAPRRHEITDPRIQAKVLARGNRQVPEVALAVCDRIGMQSKDLDLLVTNQPNRVFLRNWREALEVPRERHVTLSISAAICSGPASRSTWIGRFATASSRPATP